jgi:hypothetical protein
MRPPIIGTALPIAAVLLIAWSLALGSPTDTGIEWAARTLVTYPACHLAVRSYRNKQR